MSTSPEKIEQGGERRELYRDELNFAEFPLASISTSLPKDQKTLEFTDEIFDKSANKRVTRKLTITASDKFGLPTAMDDEVILGLIQLTSRTEFSSRRVFFTRYELLKLLNWADTTRNYHRLEQSLNRWLGVTLYYEKAWWSKEEQSWVNEGFHILDHVQILDQERQRRSVKRNAEQAGKSSFVWNEVVFNSFQAGYLKQLDFEFYKTLESAISKRVYRFLDKRFYHRQRLEFDLRTFACEHIGLGKNYHNGELKRVLTPAISELEECGYLERLASEERFVRKARGEWTIVFTKASRAGKGELQTSVVRETKAVPPLAQALIDRGVSASSARALVREKSEAEISEKLRLFDWLVAKKDLRIQKNAPGFLYQSIAESFSLPDDYRAASVSRANAPERKVVSLRQDRPATMPVQSAPTDRAAIDEYWSSLPKDEQLRVERELVQVAPRFLRDQYLEGQKGSGLLFQTVRQAIIDDYVRRMLRGRPAGGLKTA